MSEHVRSILQPGMWSRKPLSFQKDATQADETEVRNLKLFRRLDVYLPGVQLLMVEPF